MLQRGGGRLELYRLKDGGSIPSEVWSPRQRPRQRPSSDAQCVRSPMRHVHSLPCYESPVCLASSQRSSLLLPLAPCFVLLAWRQSGPVFPVVVGGVFAIGSLPSRRPLPHAHNAACICRVKASSPNAARSAQKEPIPPTNRWEREGLPWLESDQDSSHPQLHQSRSRLQL
jgi:hypothetical protein